MGDMITFGCALCFAIHIIAQNNYEPGTYTISWDGTFKDNSLATSGVYLLIAEMGEKLFSKKLILMK